MLFSITHLRSASVSKEVREEQDKLGKNESDGKKW